MECPECGLLNPPEALRCDCGYDFASKTMRASYLPPASPRRAGAVEAWVRKYPSAWLTVCLVALLAAARLTYLIVAGQAAASPGVTGTGVGNLGDMLAVAVLSAVLALAGMAAMFTKSGRIAGSVVCAAGVGGFLGVLAYFSS